MATNLAVRQRDDSEARRARLRDIIQEQCVLAGEFKLASGRDSAMFFNMKTALLDPEGAELIGRAIFDIVKHEDIDFIGGMAVGAVPIVSAVCIASLSERPLQGFFVRSEAKGHGTNQLIDGHFKPGSKVIIFDDVTTTGGSVMKAVKAVREQGAQVGKVITIVERLEGAKANLAAEGIELVHLYTKADFKNK